MTENKSGKSFLKTKLDYIKHHLVGYADIVNASLANNLLDETVLFEEFARNICEFYYGQGFINLNGIKKNWECVDLVSNDKTIYIQVSATKYTKEKINDTLNRVKELKLKGSPDVSCIKRIVFFLLNEVNFSSLSDKTIGEIAFRPKEDIVTFSMIVNRVITDGKFMDEVYEYIHSEEQSLKKLDTDIFDAIQLSKNSYLTDIQDSIGLDCFHIDRGETIKKINDVLNKITIITGDAGVGKSAVCKELMKDKEILLYARAETIVDSRTINDLWNINVRDTLKYTRNKTVTICIDSLEFVADTLRKDKILDELLSLTKEYKNLEVYVTCRTRDYDRFSNVFIKYKEFISFYRIDKLSLKEKQTILAHYPKLKRLGKRFIELIDTPLYADIIVKHAFIEKPTNETELKDIIYKKCICLEDNKDIRNKKEIRDAIRLITVSRSKERKLGVDKALINDAVLEILLNNGVVVSRGNYGVRLKYDLFEDICFSHYFNEDYSNSTDVDSFLLKIDTYGSSAFRRYQIWIDDLIQEGDYDTIATIVLNGHNEEYVKNTLIGMIVSDKSEKIINYFADNNRLDFKRAINICNQYAFELSKQNNSYTFRPIGIGRMAVINRMPIALLNEGKIDKSGIVTLMMDLIQQQEYIGNVAKKLSNIAERLYKTELENDYLNYDLLDELATIAFYTQDYSKEWFIPLVNGILDKYLNNYFKSGEKIISNLLKFRVEKSGKNVIKYNQEYLDFMFDVSYRFLTINPKKKQNPGLPFLYSSVDDYEQAFGLSSGAETFSHESSFWSSPLTVSFFISAVRTNLPSSLEYLFKLTDFIGESLLKNGNAEITTISIKNASKEFIYCHELTLLGEEEVSHLGFISDMFYVAKHDIIQILAFDTIDQSIKKAALEKISNICINKSRTIASLLLLSFFNKHLLTLLPETILTISESFELMISDSLLFNNENNPDLNKELLEKQVYSIMGIPYRKRYKLRREVDLGSCLYSLYHCDSTNKEEYIAKMNYIYEKYKDDEGVLAYYENHDGSLRKPDEVFKQQEEQSKNKDNYLEKTKFIQDETAFILRDKDFARARKLIDYILSLSSNEIALYARWLVYSAALVLMDKDIASKERDCYCSIWIKGIDAKNPFIFDDSFIISLIAQIKEDISEENKAWIKKYIFSVLCNRGENANKSQQKNVIIGYLAVNEDLRKMYLNALVGCSTVHEAVFGSDKTKNFSDKEYNKLLSKEASCINAISGKCLFNNGQFDLSCVELKKCDPFYLKIICELLLTIENSLIEKSFPVIDYLFDNLAEKDGYYNTSLFVDLPSILFNPLILNADNGIKVFEHLFTYIKEHPNNHEAMVVINNLLSKLEKLLYGNDFDRNNLFKILDYLYSEYPKIKEKDIDGNIRLGMAFINSRYNSSGSKQQVSLNLFKKQRLLSFYEYLLPTDLEKMVSKIVSYNPGILMPDVIVVVNKVVNNQIEAGNKRLIIECKESFERFISDAYFNYRETIKSNNQLNKCFDELLTNLSKCGISKANVISYHFNML